MLSGDPKARKLARKSPGSSPDRSRDGAPRG